MRLVLLSDTHRMHARIAIPHGDVIVHAGDFCGHGTENQARDFARFFTALPHRHKIVVAGNHDRCMQADLHLGYELFSCIPDCHYLFDSGVTIEGVSFWGSPWQPWFLDWAFNLQRGAPLRTKWDLIPHGTDVLITHGPPMHVLDRCDDGNEVGCEELALAVERIRPKLHVFGHIHEGYGSARVGETLFCNASNCTLAYEPTNPAIVVDLIDGRATIVD